MAYCPKFELVNKITLPNGKSTSYFYAIFGIAMVLFVVGVAGVLITEARKTSTQFKENMSIEVVLHEDRKSVV